MSKLFVTLAMLAFGLSAGDQQEQEQTANSGVDTSPPVPIAVAEVEDVRSVTPLRRAALTMQLLLTPAGFVQQAGPLHAYDNNIVCMPNFETTTLANAERYGPAAIVRENEDTLQASYYTDLRHAYQALAADNNINYWCAMPERAYIATTLPLDNDGELEHSLLLITGGGRHEISGETGSVAPASPQ